MMTETDLNRRGERWSWAWRQGPRPDCWRSGTDWRSSGILHLSQRHVSCDDGARGSVSLMCMAQGDSAAQCAAREGILPPERHWDDPRTAASRT